MAAAAGGSTITISGDNFIESPAVLLGEAPLGGAQRPSSPEALDERLDRVAAGWRARPAGSATCCGPWLTGVLHDATGSYTAAFWIAIGGSAFSALAIWLAAPRHVRAVAGRSRPQQ